MVTATYEILEIRLKALKDWNELYILLSPASDGTLGVAGWRKKTIDKNFQMMDYIKSAIKNGECFDWDKGIPD